MNTRKSLIALVLAVAFVPAAQAQDTAQYLDQSRATAKALIGELGPVLQKELKEKGPEGAIGVCKDVAPAIASNLSRKNGWRVSRVSLKTRNPVLGTPDAWEQEKLVEFDARLAKGEKADTLEIAEVVTEPTGKYYRYLKAIPTGEPCLQCHGPADKISDAVKARLAQDYPHDKATGYAPGQVRGAVTIKRPL